MENDDDIDATPAMNDTLGLIYDEEAAVHFAQTETGLAEVTVLAVLCSRDHYNVALGIDPAESLDGESAEAIRTKHPDLFPKANMPERLVWQPMPRQLASLPRRTPD